MGSNDTRISSSQASAYIYAGSAIVGAGALGINSYRNQIKDIKALKDAGVNDIFELSKQELSKHQNLARLSQQNKDIIAQLIKGKIHKVSVIQNSALGAIIGIAVSTVIGLPLLAGLFSSDKKET